MGKSFFHILLQTFRITKFDMPYIKFKLTYFLLKKGWKMKIGSDLILVLFCFNRHDCTVKTGSAKKLGQSPICHYPRSSAHWGYFGQSLTRLVQNLTLCNDCNLIPSAHGTQHLSSHSDHWTFRGFTSQSFPNQRLLAKK